PPIGTAMRNARHARNCGIPIIERLSQRRRRGVRHSMKKSGSLLPGIAAGGARLRAFVEKESFKAGDFGVGCFGTITLRNGAFPLYFCEQSLGLSPMSFRLRECRNKLPFRGIKPEPNFLAARAGVLPGPGSYPNIQLFAPEPTAVVRKND